MAATINVVTTDQVNATVCTLSDAIRSANTDAPIGGCTAGSGADTIVLPPSSVFRFASFQVDVGVALPVVSSAMVIEGNGATILRDAAAVDNFPILLLQNDGDLELRDCILSGGVGGSSGGGIINAGGKLALTRSHVKGNRAITDVGGGIFILGSGLLTLDASTVSGNSAGNNGGGIYVSSGGTAILRNSTISGNSARLYGGGLYASPFSDVRISDSTVTGNTVTYGLGGGISLGATNTVIERSLVSGNISPEQNGYSEVRERSSNLSLSQNLFGHSGLSNAQAFSPGFVPGATDITATSDGTLPTSLVDILDTTLDNNGGPTQTHALFAGSPAVDTAGSSCPATDQRGVIRPQGAACDIGAFELAVAPMGRSLSINDVSLIEGRSGSRSMRFTVRLSSAATTPVTVSFATANGSATAGSDYTARRGSVRFKPGTTAVAIEVKVKGDRTLEPDETFFVNLSNASSGTTIADSQGEGTIVNDD